MVREGAEAAKFIYLGMGPTRYAANARFATGYCLKPGDFLRADLGASVQGYGADFVRCYMLGAASRRQRDVWSALVETEIDLANSVRIGDTGDDIYQRGLTLIEQRIERCPREFVGHGIGLVLNEEPRMGAGNHVGVEAGTVFCMELSCYLDDGVRLHVEDMYYITESGIEMLTPDCPRELELAG
jgi:Xaa-Pro aminopeptidase/Xaa-Pro dipeptidase